LFDFHDACVAANQKLKAEQGLARPEQQELEDTKGHLDAVEVCCSQHGQSDSSSLTRD